MDIENAANQIGADLFGTTTATASAGEANSSSTPTADTGLDPTDNLPTGEDLPSGNPDGLVDAAKEGEPTLETPTEPKSKAPETWRGEAAQLWDSIPEKAREEILKREQDIFRGIEGYKQDAAVAKELKQTLQPFAGLMQQMQLNPKEHISNLLSMHRLMVMGSQQEKVQLLQGLAQQFGVQMDGYQTPEYIDPALDKAMAELSTLKTQFNGMLEQQREVELNSKIEQINAFASDSKNIYFAELVDDITHLLQTKACKTLPEAYETALYRNPTIRDREMKRQQAESLENARKMEKARAAKAAKAASVNVNSTSRSVGAAAPVGSMEDTMAAKLAEIKSRTNR